MSAQCSLSVFSHSWAAITGMASLKDVAKRLVMCGAEVFTLVFLLCETASVQAVPITSNYQELILSQSPMAYWRLGETTGGVAVDESGNGNDATYAVSPTLGSAGPQNPPFAGFEANNFSPAFDGSSDQRATTTLTGLNFDYSASLWIRNDRSLTAQAITGYAFARSDTTSQATSDHVGINGNNAGTGSNGDLFMHTGSAAINGTNLITDNLWHHIALTRSGNTVSLYLDGNLEVSSTLTRTFTSTNALITIGTRGDYFSDWLGNIDEVAVFNRVLTGAEIEAQYQAAFISLPVPEPSSMLLLGSGLLALQSYRKRRMRHRNLQSA